MEIKKVWQDEEQLKNLTARFMAGKLTGEQYRRLSRGLNPINLVGLAAGLERRRGEGLGEIVQRAREKIGL